MLSLPNEIIAIIAYFLESNQRIKLCEVCVIWSDLLSSCQLWYDIKNESIRCELRQTCEFGNLFSARWLTKTFNLTQEDARSGDCVLLMGARDPSLPALGKKIVGIFGGEVGMS